MSSEEEIVYTPGNVKRMQAFIRKVAEMWHPADDGGTFAEVAHRLENQPYGRLQTATLQLYHLIREARKLASRRVRNPRI